MSEQPIPEQLKELSLAELLFLDTNIEGLAEYVNAELERREQERDE